jgi:Uma2 family endonuclease
VASNPISKLTEEQYLAIERAAEFKSEFLDGEMFAMSGASTQHNRLHQNLSGELWFRLRGTGCEAFLSDMRVKVGQSGMYTYPDISVVCGKPLLADDYQDSLLNPIVLFEILSPSTEKYDRGLKFQNYRTIESLKDYLLVDQTKIRIEHYTRQAGNLWTLRDYQHVDEELKIDSIGVSIPLNGIYERVEFTTG